MPRLRRCDGVDVADRRIRDGENLEVSLCCAKSQLRQDGHSESAIDHRQCDGVVLGLVPVTGLDSRGSTGVDEHLPAGTVAEFAVDPRLLGELGKGDRQASGETVAVRHGDAVRVGQQQL